MARTQQDLGQLQRLAATQGGVVSLADLESCGVSAKAARHRINEGTWHRIGGAIVLAPQSTGATTLSDTALSWILHLTFGPQARISGTLALRRARWHLPCQSHIVVVGSKPYRQLPGVTVIRRPHPDLPPHPPGPQFVTAREALVDCLTVLPAAAAADLLDAALQKRYLRADMLADDLTARLGRGRLNAAGLRSLIARATSGSRSEAEQRMARLLQRSGTGPWVPNHRIRGDGGHIVAELDFAHVILRIAIEVDGRAFHSDRTAFERDRWRQNALVIDGWIVLRFTWEQISERPDEVIAVIQAAVAQRAA